MVHSKVTTTTIRIAELFLGAASLMNTPWFLAGAALGAPAAIGVIATDNGKWLSLVTAVGGVAGGVAADRLSATAVVNELAGEGGLTCYDMLTKGVGPACLLIVILSRSIRDEGSVAIKPVAAVALAALLLEPLFSAHVLGTSPSGLVREGGMAGLLDILRLPQSIFGMVTGRRKAAAAAAAAAVARARWLAAGAQLSLWAAVVLAYANTSLRLSRSRNGSWRTVGGYMKALRALAAKKRGTGGWVRTEEWSNGGGNRMGLVGGSCSDGDGGDDGNFRSRAHSLIGSLCEKFFVGRRWGGGGRIVRDSMVDVSQQPNHEAPPFERGEVTVRNIYCSGLDAAITGRPPSSSSLNSTKKGVGADHGSDGAGGADGGGGMIAGGNSRPFYVTLSLGSLTAKTSARVGFSPTFTEVFPLGCDCPIRGAYLTIAVVDSFEAGRSGRGDRIVGEVCVPLEAAQLVPGTSALGGGGGTGTGAAYHLSGDWELQGALGDSLGKARVGADIVVRGPPPPNSAAGRLRRRRESVGWYAR